VHRFLAGGTILVDTPAAARHLLNIAAGTGVPITEVNKLLNQHAQMSKMFKLMGQGCNKGNDASCPK